MNVQVNFKKLDERATVPTYGSEFSAGADLYAVCDRDVVIDPGKTVLIHTGLAMEIPVGCGGFIFARSSSRFFFDIFVLISEISLSNSVCHHIILLLT